MISTIFFVAWVNCTSNSLVIINEIANINMPKIIPVVAFIVPNDHMKRNVKAAPISPMIADLIIK